ncbi:class I SAM-dependent methyltransferase, partial [Ameyamaea chiangmaiensis]
MSGHPVRLDQFMARANAAYYTQRDPFADFITAPEISQVFGELLGAWAATVWQMMGSPSRVMLVEAGPGRGTLMADMLRLIGRVLPALHAAADVMLVETSPTLRTVQRDALAGRTARPVRWCDTLADVPEYGPFILVANEFLDALPIRQFVRRAPAWRERAVDGLTFAEIDVPAAPDAEPLARAVPEGEVVELCEPALALARDLGARLARGTGAALFIDYGYDAPRWGESLQALYQGKPAWPLDHPGHADLTAHVDFRAFRLAAMAAGALTQGAVMQGAFLGALGLGARVARLSAGLSPEDAGRL